MINETKIATALMQVNLPNEEIAGLMLELSDIKSPVKMPTAPCASSVERAARKGWAKVATAILSGTKEFLGSRLLKHTSLQVRRLLAEHGTDEKTLQELHNWGVAKDINTLRETLPRLDPEWLISQIEAGVKYHATDLRTIGYRAAQLGDQMLDRMEKLPAEVSQHLLVAATTIVAKNPTPVWNLKKLLSCGDGNFQSQVGAALTSRYDGLVTKDLMDAVVENDCVKPQVRMSGFQAASGFEPEAVRMLIDLDPMQAVRVLYTQRDLSLFEDYVAIKRMEVLEVLTSDEAAVKNLSQEQVIAIIRSAEESTFTGVSYRPPLLYKHLLSCVDFELDSETILSYLRHTDEHATWQWLSGKYAQKPRPGEITRLFANPKWALGWTTQYSTSPSNKFVPATSGEIASDVAIKFEHFATQPWVDEIVDAAGWEVFAELVQSYDARGRDYIVSRMTRELGTDRETWRDALAYFSKSQLPMSKTLTAIRRLRAASNSVSTGN